MPARQQGNFRPDNHRLMVWTGQSIYAWHANNLIAPNERLTPEQINVRDILFYTMILLVVSE